METISKLSSKLTEEIKIILPSLRQDLQLELHRNIGYIPKQAFFSDHRVFHAFHSEAGKFLSLAGHNENEIEHFCIGDIHINDEIRKKIHKITTLALLQLAMW